MSTPQHVAAGAQMRAAREARRLTRASLASVLGLAADPRTGSTREAVDTIADWEDGWYQPLPLVLDRWKQIMRALKRR